MTVGLPHEWRIADRYEALGAGLDPGQIQTDPDLTGHAVAYMRANAWVEESIAPGWIAAYRLVVQDSRPVVAEVRVFPDLWGQGKRPFGTWAAEHRGVNTPGVPRGGLSATVLRMVRLAGPFRHALTSLGRLRTAFPALFAPELPLGALTVRRRGAEQIDDLSLALLARAYIDAGRSLKATSLATGVREGKVRSRLQLARKRDLLSRSGKSGVRGGDLTDRARALLRNRKGKRG